MQEKHVCFGALLFCLVMRIILETLIYLISCPSKPFLFIFTQLLAYHDTMTGLNPLGKKKSCEKERVDSFFKQSGCYPVWGQ